MAKSTSDRFKTPTVKLQGVFFSPPDAPGFDSFTFPSQSVSCQLPGPKVPPSVRDISKVPLSPPVSPLTATHKDVSTSGLHARSDTVLSFDGPDPPLFEDKGIREEHHEALFPVTEEPRRKAPRKSEPTRSTPAELNASDSGLVSRCLWLYNKDPTQYLADRQAEEQEFREAKRLAKARRLEYEADRAGVVLPGTTQTKRPLARPATTRRTRVEKPFSARRTTRTLGLTSPEEALIYDMNIIPPTPLSNEHVSRPEATQPARPKAPASSEKRTSLKPKKTPLSDFSKLPDFTPPLSTLPRGIRLHDKEFTHNITTKALDLSDDPDKTLLHESELPVASLLRFTCAQYLYNKRQIFQARVEVGRRNRADRARGGKGHVFNKTAAQQACSVDVNRSSKLWIAFNNAGWFDERYFQQYL